MRVALAILATTLTAAGAALAADETINPDAALAWVSAPTAAQVAAAYPAAAKAAHQTGKAVLDCRLQPDGRLRACKTLSETPAGAGFGEAALKLTGRFTGYTSTGRDEHEIHVPIEFSDAPGTPKIVIGPTAKDFQPLIAKAAGDKSVSKAEVLLDCKVGDKGAMTGCKAASESPAGLGVGDLAVKMAPKFIASLWGANGRPTLGANVKIPLEVAIRDDQNIAATTVIEMGRPNALSPDLLVADRSSVNLKSFYPDKALSMMANGDATVRCMADAGGTLSGCAVSAELPSGQNFGEAALKIAAKLALKPGTNVHPSPDGVVLLPFSFKVK
jgi:TonB family protein